MGTFDAKIICLGVTIEDLSHEASLKGMKLPPSDVKQYQETSNSIASEKPQAQRKIAKRKIVASKNAPPKQPAIALPTPTSHPVKKGKPTAASGATEKRSQKAVQEYKDATALPFPVGQYLQFNDKLKKSSAHENKAEQVKDGKETVADSTSANQREATSLNAEIADRQPISSIDMVSAGTSSKETLQSTPEKKGEDSVGNDKSTLSSTKKGEGSFIETPKKTISSPSIAIEEFQDAESPLKIGKPPSPTKLAIQEIAAELSGPSPQSSKKMEESSIVKRKPRSRTSKIYQHRRLSESSEPDTEYVSSDEERDNERHLLLTKVQKQECEIKSLKRELASVKEDLIGARQKIEEQELELLQLLRVNAKMSEDLVGKLISATTKSASMPIISPQQEGSDLCGPKELKKSQGVSKRLFESDNLLSTPSSTPLPSAFSKELSTPLSTAALGPQTPTMTAEQILATPTSSKDTAKKSRNKRKAGDDATDEEGIVSNRELSKIIPQALDKSLELQRDGSGKVHIGNSVWIPAVLFNKKISKETVSPSIALRDATSSIYTLKELAERSLEGRSPVKADAAGNRNKKKKMTPGKRESLLGLYRAKTAQTSKNNDEGFLDIAVQKNGRSVLREKMKEAAKAISKQQKIQEQEQKMEEEQEEEAAPRQTQ